MERRRFGGGLLLTALLAGAGAAAQEIGERPLQARVEALARRAGARIVLDPALAEPAALPAEAPGAPVERALTRLAESLRGAAWRRVYLTPERERAMPDPERLAAWCRAAGAVHPRQLLVTDPTGKHRVLAERLPATALPARRAAAGLSARPVYVLLSTEPPPDGLTADERLDELQRQQLAAPVPREGLALTMERVVRMAQAGNPAALEQALAPLQRAGMECWERTPPAQRQEMMRATMQVMQAYRPAPPAGAGAPGPGAPPGAAPPAGPTLRQAAAALARSARAEVLLDPELAALAAPPLPEAGERGIGEAFEALARGTGYAAWCRLHRPDERAAPAPTELAAAARALVRFRGETLAVEEPGGEGVLVRGVLPEREALSPGLRTETSYLLYSQLPGAGGTAAERRAAALDRQLGAVLRLPPERLGRVLEWGIRRFAESDPESRERVLALPSMAALMAVWFPREAKERRGR